MLVTLITATLSAVVLGGLNCAIAFWTEGPES